MLTDDFTFMASTLLYTEVQYTIRKRRLRRKALQLTNSKKYSPPHKVHCDTTSSQMKASRDSSYKRSETCKCFSEIPQYSKERKEKTPQVYSKIYKAETMANKISV